MWLLAGESLGLGISTSQPMAVLQVSQVVDSHEGRLHLFYPNPSSSSLQTDSTVNEHAQWELFSLQELFIDVAPFCKTNIPTLSKACLLILPGPVPRESMELKLVQTSW